MLVLKNSLFLNTLCFTVCELVQKLMQAALFIFSFKKQYSKTRLKLLIK